MLIDDGKSYGKTHQRRWTYRLIPNIQEWVDRPYREVDYYVTQALSGHCCFNKYRFDGRRAESGKYRYCDEIDNTAHTLFMCKRWHEVRESYYIQTGLNFNEANMMANLRASEETFRQAYNVIRKILERKAIESR